MKIRVGTLRFAHPTARWISRCTIPVDHVDQWPEGLSLYALNRGEERS